jgi:NADH-quinone oxidoreductase subunit N
MTTSTINYLLPEIVIAATAVLIYIAGAFFQTQKVWNWLAAAGIALAMVCLSGQHGAIASGALLSDGFAFFMRWLVLGLSLLLVLHSFRPLSEGGTPEALGSLLLAIAGAMLLVSANDLILLFVSLELISIPTYILLYLAPTGMGSQESAAKYFYLSVLASAILLYGFSFIYGIAGTTELAGIRLALTDMNNLPRGFDNLAILALALTFGGLCFRLAAVPLHFYAPDVYQGTSNQNAAFLSVIPKAAGMVVLVRLVWAAMPGIESFAWQLTIILAILTMTLGNTMALWQNNLRRLMAYSSIAHAGYLLIGLAAALAMGINATSSWDGIAALVFYLCVYMAATLGTFAMLEFLGGPQRRLESVEELAGLGRSRPACAAMIAVFMFSLTGIPPMAGFWGKLYLFGSALNVDATGAGGGNVWLWFLLLAIIGVLNAAISAGYYLRIVGVMYFRSGAETPRAQGGWGTWTAAAASALVIIILGLYPRPLMKASNYARPEISQGPKIEKTTDLGN